MRLFVVDRPDRPLGEPRAKLLSAGHHLQHGTCRSAQPHTIWFIHIQTITSTMIRAYRSMPHSSVRAALRYLQHGTCRSAQPHTIWFVELCGPAVLATHPNSLKSRRFLKLVAKFG